MAMESRPIFKFPPKDTRPLHQLPPELVNIRTTSTTTTLSKLSQATEDDTSTAFPPPFSTQSSPIRKANLFADYHPKSPKTSQTTGFALPQSPSLPEIHALRSHVRTNSDVQGLVKRFEHLDVRDRDAESVERRQRHEAELRRAQIAREEAESDVRRLREECRRLRKENDESRDRERRVGKRLEVVMEEFASAKDQYESKTAVYEKEVRKARKEAFKSSSAVVKLQEELKSTRNSLRITQSGFDLEKQKVQRREKETFDAQYQLAAVQEELNKLRVLLKIAEEQNEALKTRMKEEEVAKIAADGMIALPVSQEDDQDHFSSPRKRSPLSDDKENIGPDATPWKKARLETKRLEEELLFEQMRREHAEEVIDFLGLECRFRCCRCQIMSNGHSDLGSDLPSDLKQVLENVMDGRKGVLDSPEKMEGVQAIEIVEPEAAAETTAATADASSEQGAAAEVPPPEEDPDRSVTMTADGSEEKPPPHGESPVAPQTTPIEPILSELAVDAEEPVRQAEQGKPVQQYHRHASIRTITTTTTIPMHFTPVTKPVYHVDPFEDAENIPPASTGADGEPVFDRAAALAAIEYRRGRAKSFAAGHLTPCKQMLEGVKERRDISAPTLGGKGPGNYVKGSNSVGRAAGRRVV